MQNLYYNGTILTMELDEYTEAVLTEEGKIKKTGSFEELKKNTKHANLVNLQGKTMMPGFIDAHSHFSQVTNSFLQVSADEINNIHELEKRVSEFISKLGDDEQWVIINSFDNSLFSNGKTPSIETLDKLSQGFPLIIQHKSGHMGWFNTIALERLKVTANTVSPQGGKIEVNNGKLTGYMEENAYFKYMKMVPMPKEEELLNAYKLAQDKYASYGITTVQEGYIVAQMLPLYKMMLKSELLYLDIVGYVEIDSIEKAKEIFPNHIKKYAKHFKLGGLKMFLDGSPQGRTAWMCTPYKGNEKDYYGYGTLIDADVEKNILISYKERMQVLAHCNGDAAVKQYERILEKCEQEYPTIKELRPVIIHAQLMREDQMKLAKKLGMIASFFISHIWYWGDVHIKNFGIERASKISSAGTALKHGLPFTFHQDSPVVEPDMLHTIWCAVNRRTKSGTILGNEERISIQDALKAITINAAYQYFEECVKGSIKEGKVADFVILDKNPLQSDIKDINKIKVLQTIKDDKIVYTV